jgi:predicted ATP-grasp superfamily ATP-dependent carboligase
VAITDAVVADFGLVGVGGIDFVTRDGVVFPVEVNPRWTASMELAERAYGLSVFAAHVRGCAGVLPELDLAALRRGSGAVGKAVLFARRTVTMGDTRPWLADGDLRDVPHPDERIPRGHPICTIFARGRTATECRAALGERAARLYDEVEGRRARRARSA